jgi:hypothetical protein
LWVCSRAKDTQRVKEWQQYINPFSSILSTA